MPYLVSSNKEITNFKKNIMTRSNANNLIEFHVFHEKLERDFGKYDEITLPIGDTVHYCLLIKENEAIQISLRKFKKEYSKIKNF